MSLVFSCNINQTCCIEARLKVVQTFTQSDTSILNIYLYKNTAIPYHWNTCKLGTLSCALFLPSNLPSFRETMEMILDPCWPYWQHHTVAVAASTKPQLDLDLVNVEAIKYSEFKRPFWDDWSSPTWCIILMEVAIRRRYIVVMKRCICFTIIQM